MVVQKVLSNDDDIYEFIAEGMLSPILIELKFMRVGQYKWNRFYEIVKPQTLHYNKDQVCTTEVLNNKYPILSNGFERFLIEVQEYLLLKPTLKEKVFRFILS